MCKIKIKKEKLELESKITGDGLEKKKDNKDKAPKKKREKVFFKRLGEFVVRRYKIILIVSLLSLASAIYPAYLLQGELKYNDQDFLPQNLESSIGIQILEDQFDSNISRLSTIIVIDSDELISSEDNLAYIEALTQGISDSNFTDDVARVDNIVSTFNEYNSTYWSEMNQAQAVINEMLVNNLTYANAAIHQAAQELNTTMKQIAGLYLMTWFNFSRTYYYGHYDSNLFSVGPLNSTVLQTIALDTNFTTGFAIAPEYVSLVYNYANSLGNHAFVNDVVVNDFALNIANMSLFYASNMTLEEYQEQLYPLLDMYYQYWKQSFQQTITIPGVSIVNGTSLSENLYDNSTIPNAYVSQGTTLGYLQMVNNTAFQNIDIRNMILSQASEFFDLSDPQIMAFLSSEYLETIIEAVYDLGPNPSQLAIQALSSSITEQIIQGIILANPSIPSIEEFCTSPQVSNITRWFLSTDGKCSIYLVSYDVSRYSSIEEKDRVLVAADKWIGEYSHQLISDMNLTQTRIYHTGEIFITESITTSSGEAAGSIDIFAVVFVVIALLLIFTSLIAPLIPLLTIGIAIVISFAFLFWVSKAMDIHYLSTLILTIISLGAGVDYCIFIYSRYTEELKRGISIRLGYADAAFYKCPKCDEPECYTVQKKCPNCGSSCELLRVVSFVDAPGHETLMATMLSGAAIMDGAVLVIAANEKCPQPQTREHLTALEISSTKNIVIVQNKIDLISEKDAVKNYEQITKFVKGTCAENVPIVPVSAHHDINIDVLIKTMEKCIPTPERDTNKPPLMYIARSFDINKPGAKPPELKGGVVGGSLVQGVLKKGDEIEISPGRRIEVDGKQTFEPIITNVYSFFSGGIHVITIYNLKECSISTGGYDSIVSFEFNTFYYFGSMFRIVGKSQVKINIVFSKFCFYLR